MMRGYAVAIVVESLHFIRTSSGRVRSTHSLTRGDEGAIVPQTPVLPRDAPRGSGSLVPKRRCGVIENLVQGRDQRARCGDDGETGPTDDVVAVSDVIKPKILTCVDVLVELDFMVSRRHQPTHPHELTGLNCWQRRMVGGERADALKWHPVRRAVVVGRPGAPLLWGHGPSRVRKREGEVACIIRRGCDSGTSSPCLVRLGVGPWEARYGVEPGWANEVRQR